MNTHNVQLATTFWVLLPLRMHIKCVRVLAFQYFGSELFMSVSVFHCSQATTSTATSGATVDISTLFTKVYVAVCCLNTLKKMQPRSDAQKRIGTELTQITYSLTSGNCYMYWTKIPSYICMSSLPRTVGFSWCSSYALSIWNRLSNSYPSIDPQSQKQTHSLSRIQGVLIKGTSASMVVVILCRDCEVAASVYKYYERSCKSADIVHSHWTELM